MTAAAADEGLDSAGARLRSAYVLAVRTLALATRERPRLIVAILVATVIAAVLPPAALYVSKLMIDGVLLAIDTGAADDRRTALIWVAVEAGLVAGVLALRRLLVFLKGQLHAELGFAVSDRILGRTASMSLAQIEDASVQEQIIVARQFATSRPYSLVNRLLDALLHGLTLVSLMALLLAQAPGLILLVIAGGLPIFVGNLRFSSASHRFYTSRTPQMRERNYLESLLTQEAAARERLHFGFGTELRRRFTQLFTDLHGEDSHHRARQMLLGSSLELVGAVVFLAGKLWIVAATIGGVFSLGQMTMLVGLLKQGQSSLGSLLSCFTGGYEDLLYVKGLFVLLDLPGPGASGAAEQGPDPADGLRFDHVSFTYPGADMPALDELSLHLPPGTQLGLVGANGSGKTTLVKLATGLYAPDAGRVLLDGLDLRAWNIDVLRRRIAVLFQPYMNYKLTARDNVSAGTGLQSPDGDRMQRALQSGLAGEMVEALRGGLDARLSKRFPDGQELSGGQWQRLAVARAHVNEDADILVLDEPTAALDAAAEAEFIRRDRGGRSLILISHRLANLRAMDLIVVLGHGRVLESGSHDALVSSDGHYAALFELQAEAYR